MMMVGTEWNREQDKLFERLLLMFPEQSPDRWQNIASQLPGKSPRTVKEHYDALVHDVQAIEWGRVQLPTYADDPSANQISFGLKHSGNSNHRHDEPERKKGTPWTPDEHRLFLIGLSKYGKGDWRSISRNVVVTRTPTQVASHAQKYFLRQDSVKKKDRKRSSIHDITTVDNNSSPVLPPVGGHVQQQPPPIDPQQQQQQPSALQKFLPPPSQFPGHGGSEEHQNNFGYGI